MSIANTLRAYPELLKAWQRERAKVACNSCADLIKIDHRYREKVRAINERDKLGRKK